MRYFVPDLDVRAVPPTSTDGPEKLGGLPEGLPAARRPHCAQCGGAMSLVALFEHHPERLPLGREGRRLYIFMCEIDPGRCASWDRESGANACLVVEPEDIDPNSPGEAAGSPVWEEAVITGWTELDDGIEEGLRTDFFSDAAYFGSGENWGVPEDLIEQVPEETKLGSVPSWIQSPDEAPQGWDFLGQIDSQLRFRRPPRRIEPWMSPGDGTEVAYWGPGANFGDCGIAYLFADRRQDPPAVAMFWQCS